MSILSFRATVALISRNFCSRLLSQRGFIRVVLASVGVALCSAGYAVSPPPDGGYPNQNTAEGDSALFNLTNRAGIPAVGDSALCSNTMAPNNTADGADALENNTSGASNTAVGVNALEANTT